MSLVGRKVDIVFTNSIRISGIVISWSENQSVIESEGNTIVIYKTSDNVLFYRIVADKKEKIANFADKFAEKLEEVKSSQKPATKEDIKTLAELKVEAIKEEKELVKQRVVTHEIKERKPVEYVLPNFFKKSSSIEHSTKETSREVDRDNRVLSQMRKQEKR